jgi:carbonic anhydrase/acetyltransferase-like protein (isoleucine patch superfamily)
VIVPIGNSTPQVHPTSWIAPTAVLAGDVDIGAEASIWYSAVVRGDFDSISVGARSNIQDGAVLHTDDGLQLHVGSGVTVGHGALLHGCRVEDDVLVGMGSIIMNRAVIGSGSIVAAGTLIPEGVHIPPRSLVRGSPGRVARETTDDELALIRLSADVYAERAPLHQGPQDG